MSGYSVDISKPLEWTLVNIIGKHCSGECNNLYREKAARIIEVPDYSVSLLCLQDFPKKIIGGSPIT